MKEKPLELDLSKVDEIAEKFGVTPQIAMGVFNEIYNVANPLVIQDPFFPPWSNKKIIEINPFMTIHISHVGLGGLTDPKHELRIRVFQEDDPCSEHVIVLPNPRLF